MKADWQTTPFEDCIEAVTYTTKIQRKDFLSEGAFPIVSQEEDLINGRWENDADLFKVERPLVLFGDHTRSFKYVDFDFVLGADGVKILKPKAFLHPRYFYFQLHTAKLESLGYARHYRLLKEHSVSYPDFAEQHRIVTLLDEAFAEIATAKANAEKNLQNARDFFAGQLQDVFDAGIDNWNSSTLGQVYDVRDGTHDSPKYHDEGFPLITSKNLKNEGLTFDDVKLISLEDYNKINERSAVHQGDVLLAMIGTIGNPTVVETIPNFAIKNVALLKVPENQNSYFLRYYLSCPSVITKMQAEAKGTTQKFVGLGYLRAFPINVPDLLEQDFMIGKLDEIRAETNRLEAIYRQKIAALDDLKKSLLHQAFSGQL